MATDASRRLASIAIVTEAPTANPMRGDSASGNLPLLLREIRHALERLLEDGATHVIDLRALPLGPGEEERLLETLGTGELAASFDALGRTELQECGFPGVWRVTHWSTAGEVSGRFIEVTFAPALLASDREDVQAGLLRLSADIVD